MAKFLMILFLISLSSFIDSFFLQSLVTVLILVEGFFLATYQYIETACVKRPKFRKKEIFTGFHTQIRFLSTQAGPKKPVDYFTGWEDLLPPDFSSKLYKELPYNYKDHGPTNQFVYTKKNQETNKVVNEYRKLLREGKKKGKSVWSVTGNEIVQWFSEFRTFLLNSKTKYNTNLVGDDFDDLKQLFSSNVEKSKTDPEILKKLQNSLFRSSCFLLSENQVKTVTDFLSYESYLFISEMKRQMSSYGSDSKLDLLKDPKYTVRRFFKLFQEEVFFPHLEAYWEQNEDRKDVRPEYDFYLTTQTHDFSLLFAYIYLFLVDSVKPDKHSYSYSRFCALNQYEVINAINKGLYHYLYHICIKTLKKKASGFSDDFCNNFFLEANGLFNAFMFDGSRKKYRTDLYMCGPPQKENGPAYQRMQFLSQFVILAVLSNMEGGLLSRVESRFDKIKLKTYKFYYFKFKRLSFSYSETFPFLIKPVKKTDAEFIGKRKQGKNNFVIFNESTVNYLNICDRTSYFVDKNTIKIVEDVLTSEENLFFNSYKELAVPTCGYIDQEIQAMVEEVRICDQICSGFFFLLKRSTKKGRIRKKVRFPKGGPETLPSGDCLPTLFDSFGVSVSAPMLVETYNRLKFCSERLSKLFQKKNKMKFYFIQLQYAKILQGYELYFLNKVDFRLRLWSFVGGNALFSRNKGFSKYFVCGPTLKLTFSGFKTLLKSYYTFNKKAVFFSELMEAGPDAFSIMEDVRIDMFKTLKLTNEEKGKDYFFLSLLELTIEESLLTKKTGFLMPVDQKSSVWVFTGLFFRNKKIMELTGILSNPWKLNLISYLQAESKGLLLALLKTKGPVTQEFYNNVVLLVDVFSKNREYHKKVSMLLILGAGKLSIEETLHKLLVEEEELTISDNLISVIPFFLNSYSDFLDQKLGNIMKQIKLFKTFSMKYFTLKFNYIKKTIESKVTLIKRHQSFLKDSTENSESFLQTTNHIKNLKKDISDLEKRSCFSFRILSGEIGCSQDVVQSHIRKQISLPLFTENRKVKVKKLQPHYLELRGNLPATRRQLMSSMIHSLESTILRDILLSLDKEGIQINHCHDCFQVHPNHYEKFISTVHKVYFQRFQTSSSFWDLSNTLINVDGVFWLEDPILTADQRSDLQKKFDKFTSTFYFKKMSSDWMWSRKDAIASYPFENK